jgi:spore coat protein A
MPLPRALTSDFGPPTAEDLAAAPRRAIALVEQELEGAPNMLTMRELAPAADGDSTEPLISVIAVGADETDRTIARLRTVACHFEDSVTIFPTLGQYEVWQFINLTGDTHPMHIHLDPFQLLARRPVTVNVPDGGITNDGTTATVRHGRGPGDGLEHALDANELGLKDTVRVNPHEIVELTVRFETYSGRYMYHCHILEHEDRDMMRPFVIMPMQLMPFMG